MQNKDKSILQCKISGKIFSNDDFFYLLKSIKLYKKDKVEIYILPNTKTNAMGTSVLIFVKFTCHNLINFT